MSSFDALAPTYDVDFTHQPIGQLLRSRVHQRLLTHFSAGDRLLEIGCGTGEDALFLAEQGLTLIATDDSDEMLAITREKTKHLPNISVNHFNIADITQDDAPDSNHLDGVFSNFGALNCIDNWQSLAEYLSGQVKSGGIVCFGIMSPYCAWEFIWHALHFKWNIALRRLRGDRFGDLTISYPTIHRITEDFAPHFKRINVLPLGLFLPTSALFDVVQKRPQLMESLVSLEERFQNTSQLALLADHYWIEFEKI